MKKKIISITLIVSLLVINAFISYAEPKGKDSEVRDNKKIQKTINKESSKGIQNTFRESKAEIEAKKNEAEALKHQIETEYEAAVASGDTELANQLSIQLQEAHKQFKNVKTQFINQIEVRKKLIKSNYTEDELNTIEAASENILSENPDAAILDIGNIFSNKANFKFDTPPVIKTGRTVIPVRAITRGFGADLNWDPETQEVTISKDNIIISLTIDSDTALVNGEEILLDSKAELMNNRTYVPLRFIMETLGLIVEWDDETNTIEINDPDEGIDDSRTDSAIEASDE